MPIFDVKASNPISWADQAADALTRRLQDLPDGAHLKVAAEDLQEQPRKEQPKAMALPCFEPGVGARIRTTVLWP